MKAVISGTALLLLAGVSQAQAACYYDGVYYEAGTQLCFDGWVQECTVADYWSAVGMCHRSKKPAANMSEAMPLHLKLSALNQRGALRPGD